MAKINVDYEKLYNAQGNINVAISQASSIKSKINSVISSLDSRVRGRVLGLSSLSSTFNNVESNLSQFSDNLLSTINQLYYLENNMESAIPFHFNEFLLQNLLLNDNKEEIRRIGLALFEEAYKDKPEELELIKSDKGSPQARKLYKWLIGNEENLPYHEYKNMHLVFNLYADMNKSSVNRFNEQVESVILKLLQTIVDKDSESSNARYPKELAVIYGNVATSNPFIHFGYGGYYRNDTVLGNGFEQLLEHGFTDCIGFVRWSYYQSLRDIYNNDPEKMKTFQKNIGFDIATLIELGRIGEEGTYYINYNLRRTTKDKTREDWVSEMTDYIESGDVIAAGIPGKKDSYHVILIKDVDKENQTISILESNGRGLVRTEGKKIEDLILDEWTDDVRESVAIIKGDKITSIITGSPIEEVAYKTYGQDISSIGESINSIFSDDTQASSVSTPSPTPTTTPNNQPISSGKMEGRFIDKFNFQEPHSTVTPELTVSPEPKTTPNNQPISSGKIEGRFIDKFNFQESRSAETPEPTSNAQSIFTDEIEGRFIDKFNFQEPRSTVTPEPTVSPEPTTTPNNQPIFSGKMEGRFIDKFNFQESRTTATPELTSNAQSIFTDEIEGRFIDNFIIDTSEPQIVHKKPYDYLMRDNPKK